jgi:hypothetical protein
MTRHNLWYIAMLLAAALLICAVELLKCAHAGSDSSYHCPGFEPYPPVGCKGKPRCICDADGHCSWVFDCN